mgnify:CR=1 FL=1
MARVTRAGIATAVDSSWAGAINSFALSPDELTTVLLALQVALVGAVVVFLTWLYLSAYILLMGGELNAELEKERERPAG